AADLDQAVLASTHSGAAWFGHFLHDDLPLELLAATLGRMVGHARPVYGHEPAWRKALGTPAPERYGMLRVRELTVLDDIGQNPAKRQRYATLRARLEGKLGTGDRVVLRRPAAGGAERRIRDEEKLWERLAREGFVILDPAVIGVDGLLEKCGRASVVV